MAKGVRMARRSPRPGAAGGRLSGRIVLVAALVVVVVLAIVFVRSRSTGASSLSHVHGMVMNPADGLLYVGTHEGLFRVEVDQGRTERVGEVAHDFMGLTVVGPDHFLASGHPVAVTRELPANLGLIETLDAGETWRAVSLFGQADLHAMRIADGRLYAYGNGTLAMSEDQGQRWTAITSGNLADFIVTNAGSLLATTRGGLVRGPAMPGARLSPQAGPPLLWLAVAPDASIWGVTGGGEVFRSTDDGVQWDRRGELDGLPAALLATADGLYLALADGELYRSADGGATWAEIGA